MHIYSPKLSKKMKKSKCLESLREEQKMRGERAPVPNGVAE